METVLMRSLTLCMMIAFFELYIFIQISVTMIKYQKVEVYVFFGGGWGWGGGKFLSSRVQTLYDCCKYGLSHDIMPSVTAVYIKIFFF